MSTDGAGSSSELSGAVSAIIACHSVNGALENAWNFLAVPKIHEKSFEVDFASHAHATAGVSVGQQGKGKRRDGENPPLARLDPPRPPKRVAGSPFQSWGVWGDLFNCIVSLRERSQLAKQCAESIVAFFPSSKLVSIGSRCLVAGHVLGLAEA